MELRSGVVKQQRTPLPPAAKSAFEEGARFTFRRWTALCLAVEQQWGGSGSAEKANWMLQESINWFYGSKGEGCGSTAAKITIAAGASQLVWLAGSTPPGLAGYTPTASHRAQARTGCHCAEWRR